MKNKNVVKILLDITMALILVLLYNSHAISIAFHEVAGLFLFVLFTVHCLLNKKWIASVSTKFFSKSLSTRVRFGYVIDLLLLVSFVLIIISGIMTSQFVIPIFDYKGSPWRYVHHFFAAISIILVGIHLGLHWNFVMGMFRKKNRLPKSVSKPISYLLLIAIIVFGVYGMAVSDFTTWLTEPLTIISSANSSDSNGDVGHSNGGDTNNHSAKAGENKGSLPQNGTGSGDTIKQDEKKSIENEQASINDKSIGQAQSGDMSSHPEGEKKTQEGSLSVILLTIATYISILGVFTAITYYLEKLLRKKGVDGNA